jgi:type II secretory ATPase GspE/PulE/Tfp pilus assembly ATPase PilB-like protein
MDLAVLIAQVPSGGYISVWKSIPVILVLLVWAKLLTWIDKDADAAHLPRVGVNLGNLASGILGFAIFFFLPTFLVAFVALIVVISIGLGAYFFLRHQKVGLHDLRGAFSNWLSGLFKREKKLVAGPGQVMLFDRGGNMLPAPEAEDEWRPAYDAVQNILTDPLEKGAERIEIVPGEGASSIRYFVDGMSYSGGSIAKADAAAGVTYMKQIAGMAVADKRKPQTGNTKVSLNGEKRELRVTTAGSSAGESMVIQVDVKKRHSLKLEEVGMSREQYATMKESIAESGGLVLVAAPKGQGLTTFLYAILRAHDAFLQHILTVERNVDQELEGITQDKVPPGAAPGEEFKRVAWVISQEPAVLMVSDVQEPKSAQALMKYAGVEGKRIYVGMRAGSAFEALSTWRKLVGDDQVATRNLSMVIAGRVLRKLCMACKVGYTPDPATLRKLNMDPDKISKLFQARTEPLRDQRGNPVPCEFCKELRFAGRTGVYEILNVDDEVRKIVMSGGSENQLKPSSANSAADSCRSRRSALLKKAIQAFRKFFACYVRRVVHPVVAVLPAAMVDQQRPPLNPLARHASVPKLLRAQQPCCFQY